MPSRQTPLAVVSLADSLSPTQIPQNDNIKESRTDLVFMKFGWVQIPRHYRGRFLKGAEAAAKDEPDSLFSA